jgi:hypothetical protein
MEGNPMVIYPVPVEVTQARIQLVVDQTAKAAPQTINDDLKAVYQATAVAEQATLSPAETSLVDVKA